MFDWVPTRDFGGSRGHDLQIGVQGMRLSNVFVLRRLVSTGEQQDVLVGSHCEIDAVAGTIVDSKFVNTSADRSHVARIPKRKSPYSNINAHSRSPIFELQEPVCIVRRLAYFEQSNIVSHGIRDDVRISCSSAAARSGGSVTRASLRQSLTAPARFSRGVGIAALIAPCTASSDRTSNPESGTAWRSRHRARRGRAADRDDLPCRLRPCPARRPIPAVSERPLAHP